MLKFNKPNEEEGIIGYYELITQLPLVGITEENAPDILTIRGVKDFFIPHVKSMHPDRVGAAAEDLNKSKEAKYNLIAFLKLNGDRFECSSFFKSFNESKEMSLNIIHRMLSLKPHKPELPASMAEFVHGVLTNNRDFLNVFIELSRSIKNNFLRPQLQEIWDTRAEYQQPLIERLIFDLETLIASHQGRILPGVTRQEQQLREQQLLEQRAREAELAKEQKALTIIHELCQAYGVKGKSGYFFKPESISQFLEIGLGSLEVRALLDKMSLFLGERVSLRLERSFRKRLISPDLISEFSKAMIMHQDSCLRLIDELNQESVALDMIQKLCLAFNIRGPLGDIFKPESILKFLEITTLGVPEVKALSDKIFSLLGDSLEESIRADWTVAGRRSNSIKAFAAAIYTKQDELKAIVDEASAQQASRLDVGFDRERVLESTDDICNSLFDPVTIEIVEDISFVIRQDGRVISLSKESIEGLLRVKRESEEVLKAIDDDRTGISYLLSSQDDFSDILSEPESRIATSIFRKWSEQFPYAQYTQIRGENQEVHKQLFIGRYKENLFELFSLVKRRTSFDGLDDNNREKLVKLNRSISALSNLPDQEAYLNGLQAAFETNLMTRDWMSQLDSFIRSSGEEVASLYQSLSEDERQLLIREALKYSYINTPGDFETNMHKIHDQLILKQQSLYSEAEGRLQTEDGQRLSQDEIIDPLTRETIRLSELQDEDTTITQLLITALYLANEKSLDRLPDGIREFLQNHKDQDYLVVGEQILNAYLDDPQEFDGPVKMILEHFGVKSPSKDPEKAEVVKREAVRADSKVGFFREPKSASRKMGIAEQLFSDFLRKNLLYLSSDRDIETLSQAFSEAIKNSDDVSGLLCQCIDQHCSPSAKMHGSKILNKADELFEMHQRLASRNYGSSPS